MKQTLFLHIGHPKTGSSAFQTMLARARRQLKDAGILYPDHPSLSTAERGHITSGNVSLSRSDRDWFANQILATLQSNTGFGRVVFSNENLIHRMDEVYPALTGLRDGIRVHVLLATRQPLEQLSSAYQQFVKRHGYTQSYSHFLAQHGYRCRALQRAAEVIARLEELGTRYSLFNYSALRGQISSALMTAIGLQIQGLQLNESSQIVNRSLAASELQLLQIVNALFGQRTGRRLSDALVNTLPTIPAATLTASSEEVAQIQSVNHAALAFLNCRLPGDQQLNCQPRASEAEDSELQFTTDQIAVIRDVLRETLSVNPEAGSARDISALVANILILDAHASQDSQRQTRRLLRRLQRALKRDSPISPAEMLLEAAPGRGRNDRR